MDVILIKSIENIYVAPILKKKNLKMKVNNFFIIRNINNIFSTYF